MRLRRNHLVVLMVVFGLVGLMCFRNVYIFTEKILDSSENVRGVQLIGLITGAFGLGVCTAGAIVVIVRALRLREDKLPPDKEPASPEKNQGP
jgi:hypothetical protein